MCWYKWIVIEVFYLCHPKVLESIIAWSKEGTVISVYEQEFGAPVAVPFACSKYLFANTKLLL